MAKITRRAVASSQLSASGAATISSYLATPYYIHNNRIRTAAKTSSSRSNYEYAAKYVEDAESLGAAAANMPDPLRIVDTGGQFTVQTVPRAKNKDYATTTLRYPSTPVFSTARPISTTLADASFSPFDDTAAAATSAIPPDLQNMTLKAERQRIRAEFFATYDVMTGVRIAATLGGFFGLMVFLIVWKSRSSSNETLKVLKDPKMAAVAAVCMQEEEDRKIQEAMVATGMSIYPDEYDTILYRRQRMMSLGNVSAPPVLHRGYRFSSVGGGGYSSLLEPPRRFSYSYGGNSGSSLLIGGGGGGSVGAGRRKSGSESSRILSNYPMGSSFGMDDFFLETDDELDNGNYPDSNRRHLEDIEGAHHKRNDSTKSGGGISGVVGGAQSLLAVPHAATDSRRSSAMTCCSTESSYLERRCSAFTLGLSNLPPTLQRKLSTASRTSSTDLWDYYYPDIQVIQPTPKASPSPSDRSAYEQQLPPPTATTAATAQTATNQSFTTTTTAKTTIKTASPTTAANGAAAASTFVRKHSIAYYDPESAQAGRKQQIHSISADTVDMFPYNQPLAGITKPTNPKQSFHYNDSPTEELRLNVRRKIAVVERTPSSGQQQQQQSFEHNNNSFPYSNSAAAIAAAAAVAATNNTTALGNSSSLSMDSTPHSLEKLNGSGSFGTARTFFNPEKRAPLASLSSFKISSIEYQDSDLRSLDEDSVFLDSVADTDEDMQQFSSDSEEASLGASDEVAAPLTVAVATPPPAITLRSQESQQQRHLAEKRYSLGAAPAVTTTITTTPTNNRPRRPLLQRHRTISTCSSDRISLIGQQLQDFSLPPAHTSPTAPLETHFGAVISSSSPPTHPRRAQLLQQYSDPQSLPTNTTNTTEEDTCSTLNTEVFAAVGGAQRRDSSRRCSPLSDVAMGNELLANFAPSNNQRQQLPRSRLADDDACLSSISDSVIIRAKTEQQQRQPIICVPNSLKNLIIRGSTSAQAEKLAATPTVYALNRSATHQSMLERNDSVDEYGAESTTCPSVMLELPLIKLPTDESSDSSTASNDIEHSRSRSASDESRDPSLPGSSRKWSKETLF